MAAFRKFRCLMGFLSTSPGFQVAGALLLPKFYLQEGLGWVH